MEADLRHALYSAVGTLAADQGLRVAFPNVAFDPRNDAAYLRVNTLPVPPDVRGVTNGWSRYVWLFQVSVYVRDSVGELGAMKHVDSIRTTFPFRHEFVGAENTFLVTQPATVAPPISMDGWLAVPTTIPVQILT